MCQPRFPMALDGIGSIRLNRCKRVFTAASNLLRMSECFWLRRSQCLDPKCQTQYLRPRVFGTFPRAQRYQQKWEVLSSEPEELIARCKHHGTKWAKTPWEPW